MRLLPTAAPGCTETAAAMVPPLDGFQAGVERRGGGQGNAGLSRLARGLGAAGVKAQQAA